MKSVKSIYMAWITQPFNSAIPGAFGNPLYFAHPD